MIQPAGLGGRPSTGQPGRGDGERVLHPVLGQLDVAERPHQDRDGTPVLAAERALDLGLVGVGRHQRIQAFGVLLERSDLNRFAAGPSRLGGDSECRIEVRHLYDPEPADVLLGLGERAVGHDCLVAVGSDHRRHFRRQKPTTENPHPAGLKVLVEGVDLVVGLLHLFGSALLGRLRSCATLSRYCTVFVGLIGTSSLLTRSFTGSP